MTLQTHTTVPCERNLTLDNIEYIRSRWVGIHHFVSNCLYNYEKKHHCGMYVPLCDHFGVTEQI